jgi:hypothetical protein
MYNASLRFVNSFSLIFSCLDIAAQVDKIMKNRDNCSNYYRKRKARKLSVPFSPTDQSSIVPSHQAREKRIRSSTDEPPSYCFDTAAIISTLHKSDIIDYNSDELFSI